MRPDRQTLPKVLSPYNAFINMCLFPNLIIIGTMAGPHPYSNAPSFLYEHVIGAVDSLVSLLLGGERVGAHTMMGPGHLDIIMLNGDISPQLIANS